MSGGCSSGPLPGPCPRCGRPPANRRDADEGYCFSCDAFTSGEPPGDHMVALVALAALRARLGAMELRDPRRRAFTGLDVFASVLAAMEAFVRNHAMIAAMEANMRRQEVATATVAGLMKEDR